MLTFYVPEGYEEGLEQITAGKGLPVFNSDPTSAGEFYANSSSWSVAAKLSASSPPLALASSPAFYYKQPPPVEDVTPFFLRHYPLLSVLSIDNLPPLGKILSVDVALISSCWIEARAGQVVKMSPSMEKAIKRWKEKYPSATLQESSFFGVPSYAYKIEGACKYVSPVRVNLASKRIDTQEDGLYVVGTNHPDIANPLILNTLADTTTLIKARDPAPPSQPASEVAIVAINHSFIRGSSNKKGWYVTLYSPELGIQTTVQTNPLNGDWVYRFPLDVKEHLVSTNANMEDYKAQFTFLLHESSSISQRDLDKAREDADVQEYKGVVKYDLRSSVFLSDNIADMYHTGALASYQNDNTYAAFYNTILFKYDKEYYKDKSVNKSPIEFFKNTAARKEDVNKLLLRAYLGAGDPFQGSSDKFFVSFPDSVIDFASIDVFINVTELDHTASTPQSALSAYKHYATLGGLVYGASSNEDDIRLSWTLERPQLSDDKYSLRWGLSRPPDEDTYKMRWTLGYETRDYSDDYRLKWHTEAVSVEEDEYLLRYSSILPQEDEEALFYDFSWTVEGIHSDEDNYKVRWALENVLFRDDEYSLRWRTSYLDKVVIKPFYVREGAHSHISYMVWGVHSLPAQDLVFFFSNPPKYELIRFTYDYEPYQGVFLEPLTGIPDEAPPAGYALIGNYTIKDVNPKGSFSLDVTLGDKQLNEYRSYWIDEASLQFQDIGGGKEAAPILPIFKDAHHIDIVELEIEFINERECCFTQTSAGTRCSPY